jgi:hypothetical protein
MNGFQNLNENQNLNEFWNVNRFWNVNNFQTMNGFENLNENHNLNEFWKWMDFEIWTKNSNSNEIKILFYFKKMSGFQNFTKKNQIWIFLKNYKTKTKKLNWKRKIEKKKKSQTNAKKRPDHVGATRPAHTRAGVCGARSAPTWSAYRNHPCSPTHFFRESSKKQLIM